MFDPGKFYSASMIVTAVSTGLSAIIVYINQKSQAEPSPTSNTKQVTFVYILELALGVVHCLKSLSFCEYVRLF